MSHFFREYLLYLTFEVLEPLWHVFESHAAAATNIDEIVQHHQSLLRRIMKGCLLSRRVKLLRTLVELKALALKFTEVTNRIRVPEPGAFSFEAEDDARGLHDFQKRRLRRATACDMARQCVEAASFDKAVRDLQTTFDAKYRDFIMQIGEIYRVGGFVRVDVGLVRIVLGRHMPPPAHRRHRKTVRRAGRRLRAFST